ncbi:GntR family transcriptional regulator [Streptomyces violaceusniger]|uniref:GntR family transcriptional regulator n=1 Tax=Streptomyces violaceusniger TaxID=68280 RepID=A0A4D4LKT6_STRVO|nr:GntR family transcriptional regulator [Streptomyces violaceusniger]
MAGEGSAVVSPEWLAERVDKRTSRSIADTIAELIREGTLAPGTRLPTVRALAAALGVSPATVSEAWGVLRADDLLDTGRRRGTAVRRPHTSAPSPAPANGGPPSSARWAGVDLAHGQPDPRLLPSLEAAVLAGARGPRLNSFDKDYITERLLAAVAPTWPHQPQAWTVVAGGYEGSLLACRSVASAGDAVAVEEPTAPRLLDALRRIGARPVPVRCDAHGPLPKELERALADDPVAFVYQPRAHLPLGHAVTDQRAADLARVLSRPGVRTLVVEDDNSGPLATAWAPGIGAHLPDRVVHVRSYCKTYGLDLRSCVVSGPVEQIDRIRAEHAHGMVWTSRILQDALAHLIEDPGARRAVAAARERYAVRRGLLRDALREEGVDVRCEDGLVLWVPVAQEQSALLHLASYGVTVAPGSPCHSGTPVPAHVRIAISRLPERPAPVRELAALVSAAATGATWEEFD